MNIYFMEKKLREKIILVQINMNEIIMVKIKMV
jgi:hypothetical protein